MNEILPSIHPFHPLIINMMQLDTDFVVMQNPEGNRMSIGFQTNKTRLTDLNKE